MWRAPAQREGLLIGGALAWAISSLSAAALLAARAHSRSDAFWCAFGGGLGLRLATLAGLMAYVAFHQRALSAPALLIAYALGVLAFLLLEYRYTVNELRRDTRAPHHQSL
ncbi:MAG: hypothetical protein KGO96_12540 [Elusimicrobia bacterium]|nr:hypothetical protein [Elusimicrobiota bacterium]MDE2426725.1 hypothetical protein [Elusimicrobiota bacterium]